MAHTCEYFECSSDRTLHLSILTYHANQPPNQTGIPQVWPCESDGSLDSVPKLPPAFLLLLVLMMVDWPVVEVEEVGGCRSVARSEEVKSYPFVR